MNIKLNKVKPLPTGVTTVLHYFVTSCSNSIIGNSLLTTDLDDVEEFTGVSMEDVVEAIEHILSPKVDGTPRKRACASIRRGYRKYSIELLELSDGIHYECFTNA